MAVFRDPEDAVHAALLAQGELGGIEVSGHTPELRAGVHLGRPRRVGGDYLGVDVNIAARVGEAAKGGEVLVSDSAREALDPEAFKFGRNRRLSATRSPAGALDLPRRPALTECQRRATPLTDCPQVGPRAYERGGRVWGRDGR